MHPGGKSANKSKRKAMGKAYRANWKPNEQTELRNKSNADARGQTEKANGRLKFPNHLREITVEFNWPSYKIFTSGGPVPLNPKLSPFYCNFYFYNLKSSDGVEFIVGHDGVSYMYKLELLAWGSNISEQTSSPLLCCTHEFSFATAVIFEVQKNHTS